MKPKLFFSLVAITVALSFQQAKANTRTVLNYPLGVAQYNTIQAAVDASSSGDTVLVQGSNVLYQPFTIADKKLAIIGPGWSPVRNVPALEARIYGYQTISITISGSASSGTEIQGLVFDNNVNAITIKNDAISNVRIIRNYLPGGLIYIGGNNPVTYSGYIIEGNWFFNGTISGNYSCSFNNFLIRNNLFSYFFFSEFKNCSNFILDHNLFYADNLYFPFSQGSGGCQANFTFQNNIFCKAEPVQNESYTINCTFKNNITFNTNIDLEPWKKNGNSDAGGNKWNQDPQMADQSSVNSGVNDGLLNFTIATGPANNSGSDGKDMGLLFDASGRYNWNNSRGSRIPYIFNLNIANNIIEPNTTLNVSIEARRNN